MKKIFYLILLCGFAFGSAHAQENDLELIKSKYNHEKKEIVAAFLKLPDADAKKFWPIYDDYEHERGKLSAKRMELLKQYAGVYQNMSNDQAEEIIDGVFDFQKDMMSLRKSYFKKVRKAIGARSAAAFVQVEEFLETTIRLLLQANIPYMGK